MNRKLTSFLAACTLALAAGPAADARSSSAEAQHDLNAAAAVIRQMRADPGLATMLRDSRGVLVVPHYGAGAFIAGASGGEGILLAHNGTGWSDPVFYNLGKVSVGLQAGVSAGSIAMVLLTDEAVNSFRKHNNFSLTADAGLSVVTWSRRAQADLGRGHDVIVWSDTAGLLGNVSVGVADIWLDRSENEAYYGQPVNAPQVLNGEVSGARANNRLLDALNNL